METCRTCKYFKRGKWHKSIDVEESYRLGGECDLLLKILKVENSRMWAMDKVFVQDTFGCVLWKQEAV